MAILLAAREIHYLAVKVARTPLVREKERRLGYIVQRAHAATGCGIEMSPYLYWRCPMHPE